MPDAFRRTLCLCLLLAATALGACAERDPVAAYDAADYDTARELFLPLAEGGDVQAQNYLGVIYYLGLGVPRDYTEAVRWFGLAALAGHPGAQRNLGTMYQQGLGVPKDLLRAHAWFSLAAVQGHEVAVQHLESTANQLTPNQMMLAKTLVAREMAAGKLGAE